MKEIINLFAAIGVMTSGALLLICILVANDIIKVRRNKKNGY